MTREEALRLDGMLMAYKHLLDGIAHYCKLKMSEDGAKRMMRRVGHGMYAGVVMSEILYAEFPEIVPEELIPPGGRRANINWDDD